MKEIKVLISILNWNNWSNTVATVNSVLKSEHKTFKIIVIDNNSVDDSGMRIKGAFPEIEVWALNENVGYAGAHKKAADFAVRNHFDLLWILNNDVEVFPFTLSELINAYERNGVSLLGSVSLKEDGKTINVGGGAELISNEIDTSKKYNQFEGQNFFESALQERAVADIEGASFIIPVSVIRQHGFMDTRFFLYGEEVDYCYRLRKNHNIPSIIVPAARVIHRSSSSFNLSPDLPLIKLYYFTRNTHWLHYKYHKKYKIQGNGGILHFTKFFFNHFFLVPSLDKNPEYWKKFYTKLGAFHALLGLRGKYLEPNKFLSTNYSVVKPASKTLI